jgi:ABC-type sugar transport system permease subunit
MLTIMILATWTTIGTMMVVYLAALQNISTQVNALIADVNGARAGDQLLNLILALATERALVLQPAAAAFGGRHLPSWSL